MAVGEIRQYDIGTKFLITLKDQDGVVVDVSSAITLEIIFKKPSATSVTKTASLETDGTDGQINYVTISGDLDEIGKWEMQASVVLGAGSWKTDIQEFKVYRNL